MSGWDSEKKSCANCCSPAVYVCVCVHVIYACMWKYTRCTHKDIDAIKHLDKPWFPKGVWVWDQMSRQIYTLSEKCLGTYVFMPYTIHTSINHDFVPPTLTKLMGDRMYWSAISSAGWVNHCRPLWPHHWCPVDLRTQAAFPLWMAPGRCCSR